MFDKILVANRGEIAVRIIRACHDLGIGAVALYTEPDRSSLHVRLADECVLVDSYLDQDALLEAAKATGAAAIHPGYGFFAERPEFALACENAGLRFIGPPAEVLARVTNKTGALRRVREAGFATTVHSARSFGEQELEALREEADRLGYPVIVKSCSGGRGRGARLINGPEQLESMVRHAQSEARAVYGNQRLFLEKAILPGRQVAVQILADDEGNYIHLGEREGSLQRGNQKVVEESPAPGLTRAQQKELWQAALEIMRLLHYRGIGSVEFLLDDEGRFYFTEIKARLQADHPLSEARSGIELVAEQIRLAAGYPLSIRQEEVKLEGWAILCRITATDPWNHFLPSPGHLDHVRLPGGPGVRVDTYVYSGATVPGAYDPLIAKVTVWGANREMALQRLHRALADLRLTGVPTTLPYLTRVVTHPEFVAGEYDTAFFQKHDLVSATVEEESYLRDLAVAAAIAFVRRSQTASPHVPERLLGGWHRSSRLVRG